MFKRETSKQYSLPNHDSTFQRRSPITNDLLPYRLTFITYKKNDALLNQNIQIL